MKAGDVVQIPQQDFLHDVGTTPVVSDPPVVTPGPITMWLFAQVLEVLPDGSARVRVTHPGNIRDAQESIVPAADIRTKADVEALAAKQQHTNPNWNAKLQASLKIQAERLVSK